MKTAMVATLGAAAMLAGCSSYGGGGPRYAGYNGWGAYDYDRVDPAYGGYYADRYYRDDRSYRERRLGNRDRVYVGQDGRYYCRRNDGTTGLIVGGLAGGALGAAIAPGGSGLLGAVIGGVAGSAAGQAIDRNNVRCR